MDLIFLGICGWTNLWTAALKPALRGSVRCQDQLMSNRYFLPLLFDHMIILTADLLGTSHTQSRSIVLHTGDTGISILAIPYKEAILSAWWSRFVLNNNSILVPKWWQLPILQIGTEVSLGRQQIPDPVPTQCHTSNSLARHAPSERNKWSVDSFWE